MTNTNISVPVEPPENNGQGTPLNVANSPTTGNTNSGFLVGTQPPSATQTTTQPQSRTLTPEEVAAAAQQAVTPALTQQGQTLSTMEQQMAAMQAEIDIARQEREAAAASATAAEEARLAAERTAEEEKLSASELVNKVRTEMQEQFEQMRQQAEASNAILEQERHFQALEQYKAQRLADPEISAAVMPHLHQYIGGNSEAEIEEAIARAAATSSNIVGEFQAYQQQYRQQAPGVSTAAPTAGPMESQAQQRQMSAQEIAALPPAEYARLRPQLLRAASDAHRAQQGR